MHAAPFAHGLLEHSSTSTSQVAPNCIEHERLIGSALLNVYLQTPFVKPGAQEQLKDPIGMDEFEVESLHCAPFLQGLLAHSLMSRLHLPPSAMSRATQNLQTLRHGGRERLRS